MYMINVYFYKVNAVIHFVHIDILGYILNNSGDLFKMITFSLVLNNW